MNKALYDQFGELFSYPDATYRARIETVATMAHCGSPQAAEALNRLLEETRDLGAVELEELYTRTFDLNPVAALEVGWHLYGEAYERGRFLAETRELLETHGVTENGELPDHLSHILPLLARLEPSRAATIARTRVIPAVEKMMVPAREKALPLSWLLEALWGVLAADFPGETGTAAAVQNPGFSEERRNLS